MESMNIPETIFEASTKGYSDILTCVLMVGPTLAGPNLTNAEHNGLLPLIAASSKGQSETVKILLDHGARVDAMDKTEECALIAASVKGHTEVMKVLLAHGAKVDLQGKSDGKSALNAASTKGKVESVKILLDHGAQVDSEDINGWSPLFVATMNRHVEVVKVLLEGGADPNMMDITGMCPLIKACTFGYNEIVKALLAHGAQVDIQNDEGMSPLNAASLRGFTETVSILLDHGAQVNPETTKGNIPLTYASFSGHTEVARILLKSGAKDSQLVSLLTAILTDKHEIVQLFIDYGSQVHPSAETVARCVTKNVLLEMMLSKIGTLIPALDEALKKSEASPDEKDREEVMKLQQLILETVNDIHSQSMTRHTNISQQTSSLTMDEDTLKLPVILKEFMPLYLAADWQSIGALLNLSPVQLKVIKHGNPRAVNCMREMLDAWLKTVDPLPSWEQLIEAVEIIHPMKAKTLRSRFCC